jgi:hypothetical protein
MWPAPAFIGETKAARRITRGIWTRLHKWRLGRYAVLRRNGLDFLFDLTGSMDRHLLAFGVYEPDQIAYPLDQARAIAEPGGARSVFIDIGAHWGLLRTARPSDRPVRAGHRDRGRSAQCTPASCQPVSQRGDGRNPDHRGGGSGRGTSKVIEAGEETDRTVTPVAAFRLDDVVAADGGKIDVEGYEDHVLDGMTRLIDRNRCLFQIEVFDDALEPFKAGMAGRDFQMVHSIDHDRYFRNF